MSRVTELSINGARVAVDAAADQPLLGVLREELDLTGCKIGCGEGACGACTVLVDDELTRSCVTPVGVVAGRRVRTVEGLARDGRLHPVQQAFLDAGAFQCGYCTPGMIMAALGLLARNHQPTNAEIVAWMKGNLCRCGAYARITNAIQQAAAELRARETPGGAQ